MFGWNWSIVLVVVVFFFLLLSFVVCCLDYCCLLICVVDVKSKYFVLVNIILFLHNIFKLQTAQNISSHPKTWRNNAIAVWKLRARITKIFIYLSQTVYQHHQRCTWVRCTYKLPFRCCYCSVVTATAVCVCCLHVVVYIVDLCFLLFFEYSFMDY